MAALVVEAADASLRLDRRFKAAIYARAGLPEYWIVNLVDRALEIHRDPGPAADTPDEWTYRSVKVLHTPAVVAPLAAPTAQIPVADLLP
jgi:Uma2 family endonuclease